jgi:hypothetical protein
MALLGPREMSDLSLKSDPKRTLSRHRRTTECDPEPTLRTPSSGRQKGTCYAILLGLSARDIAGNDARVFSHADEQG